MTRHDADEVIGRITKAGTLDRRYRLNLEPTEPPWTWTWRDAGREAVTVVCQALLAFLALVVAVCAIVGADRLLDGLR